MTSGLSFINTYGAGISQQFINSVVSAENALSALFTNSVTLRITFNEQALGTNNDLAENSWPSFVSVNYTQLKNALPASDSLPNADPSGGHTWSLPEAYARMQGLSSSAPSTDDTVTLNTSYNWKFGQDVINTIEHEITEGGMGRVGGLGDQNSAWSTMDLFRYSAPGVRDFTDGRDGKTTFFSNNGSTLSSLSFNNEYNSNGVKANSGDTADFTQNDVFGTGQIGETIPFSQTDIANMTAIGWNTVNTSNVFAGPSSHYTVSVTAGASTITIQDKVGSDGTHVLTSSQNLLFTDQTINTANITQTAALPSIQLVELVDTYIAYFNRAPDATGLDFWGGQLANGASFSTIANGFAGSAEATAAYPSGLSNQAFVTAVYTNVLGRNTDPGGLSFWSGLLQSGAATKASFILNVVQSVLLQTGTADAQYIANKEAVGAHFALTQGLSDGNWAKTVMSNVNGTAASVTAANALTDGFAATAATAAGSELVVKILGIVS